MPNHSAFWKRNDSRATLSSSRNAQFFVGGDDESLSVVAVCVNPASSLMAAIAFL